MKNPAMESRLILVGISIMVGLLCCSVRVASNFTNGVTAGHGDMQAAAASCGHSAIQLLPCLPAVTGSGGNPTSSCCSVLNKWGFECLCDFIDNNEGKAPSNINRTRILELPKACGIPVPADAKCGDLVPEPPAQTSTMPDEETE